MSGFSQPLQCGKIKIENVSSGNWVFYKVKLNTGIVSGKKKKFLV